MLEATTSHCQITGETQFCIFAPCLIIFYAYCKLQGLFLWGGGVFNFEKIDDEVESSILFHQYIF